MLLLRRRILPIVVLEKNPEEVLFVIKSRKFVGKDGKEKWRIDPHPFYCALCQEFKERE